MSLNAKNLSEVIQGYNLQEEKSRYDQIPDVTIGEHSLNRGTTSISVAGSMESNTHPSCRDDHHQHLFTTTHDDGAPVLELGYPQPGPYVQCAAGVYMDLMLACAQKILDENHPRFLEAVAALQRAGLLLRREINSDDYLLRGPRCEGVATPQDFAQILAEATNKSFPRQEGYRVFLCNSGAEAVEGAIKLSLLVKYKKFIQTYGHEVFSRVAADLGIERRTHLDDITGEPDPLYADYPFFLFGFVSSFHGRTLGALGLTLSKKAHQFGYPKSHYLKHLLYNGDPSDLESLLDSRPITEILDAEGGLRKVLDEGRVPTDLAAGLIAEPIQGEGGYLPGDPDFFGPIAEICQKHEILILADEVQSFARTGRLFGFEHLGIRPDAITLAKAAFVGAMVANAELEQYLHNGWHSNTWGGGRIFETQMAHATLDALLNFKDPVLKGISYLENEEIKGIYLREGMARLQQKHPEILADCSGYGLMNGMSVYRREEVIAVAWKRGLKLLACGSSGTISRIRMLMLADTLTREIDDLLETLDKVFEEVKSS